MICGREVGYEEDGFLLSFVMLLQYWLVNARKIFYLYYKFAGTASSEGVAVFWYSISLRSHVILGQRWSPSS